MLSPSFPPPVSAAFSVLDSLSTLDEFCVIPSFVRSLACLLEFLSGFHAAISYYRLPWHTRSQSNPLCATTAVSLACPLSLICPLSLPFPSLRVPLTSAPLCIPAKIACQVRSVIESPRTALIKETRSRQRDPHARAVPLLILVGSPESIERIRFSLSFYRRWNNLPAFGRGQPGPRKYI